jgi:cytochrome c3-like protein
MIKQKARWAITVSGALMLVLACALFLPPEPPVVKGRVADFPHDLHASDEVGLDCEECHLDAETEAYAGMPTLDMCWLCHEESTELDKPLQLQLAGFILPGDEEATWSKVTYSAVESNFSHKEHLESGAECLDCHDGVDQSKRVSWSWKSSMGDCVSCHEHDSGAAPVEDCVACHAEIDQTTLPANHDGGWTRVHGILTLDGPENPDLPNRNCTLCHQKSACDACHTTELPVGHTEGWRLRGHGFSALLDRRKCATCHNEASCDSCHSTVTPKNHRASWGGKTSSHCISCHLPSGSEDTCNACHRGTPSHQLASIRPGPPHPGPGSDCRSCHIPLNHIDNGQSCTLCHH